MNQPDERARPRTASRPAAAAGIRVAAGITTFNRRASLERCLACLRAQTRPPDLIVVVDDGSTDDTAGWLDRQSDLHVIRRPDSQGCASSFETAIRAAYERGFDAVFVLDDDAYPTPDVLALLLARAEELAVAGRRVGGVTAFQRSWSEEDPPRIPFALPKTVAQALVYSFMSPDIGPRTGAAVEIDLFTFVGTLFPRAAIATVGFPDDRYFYYGEDVDYALRLRRHGFTNFLVPDAVIDHAGAARSAMYLRPVRSLWRYYYIYRNQWALLARHHDLLGGTRSAACRARLLTGAGARLAFELAHGNLAAARLILKGLRDGMLGVRGKRVVPG